MFINIALFFLIATIVRAQNDAASAACVNWESTAADYDQAFALWEAPTCYTFTYKINQMMPTAQITRTVKNGKPVGESDASTYKTIDEFWNSIEAYCIRDCPTDGAHMCDIQYERNEINGFMYPASIFIDFDAAVYDEERSITITDVRSIACSEEETEEENVAHEPCVNWESNTAAYEKAIAKWTSPSCYTFTYAYTIAEMIKGQSQKRFVKSGQPVQMNYPYPEFETIDEFWTLIQENCIQDCPTIGAHSCNIEYTMSDDGSFMFPSSIEIDFNSSSDASKDTHIYSLFNVSSVDCSGIQEMENVLCVDWESTAAAYEAAYEQWTAPSCYSFTYSFSNSTINNLETKRSVRDGVSLLSGDDGELHTLDDFWSFILTKCIQGCPTSGAYSCRVNYFMNEEGGFMYPIDLYIDMDGRIFGTDTYRIYDLRIGECPEVEEEEVADEELNEPCVDWETTAEAYEDAWAQWKAPSCYTFGFSFDGITPSATRTVVHGEALLEDESSPFSELRTLEDFWGLIQRECIQDCPVSGAHSCEIEYAMHEKGEFMFPEEIDVTRNSFDGFLARIDNVQVIPCPGEREESEEKSSKRRRSRRIRERKATRSERIRKPIRNK